MANKGISQKYNLTEELMNKNEELKDSLSLLGMTGLTQPSYINSMRSVMFTSHLKQFVNLLNPEFPGFFTNMENLVGKYSTGYKKAKKDFVVYKKIEKFGDIIDTPFRYTLFTFNEKNKKYDVITRKPTENLTEMFGFDYNNEYIDSLEEGDFVPKGDVLYKSTSYDENMNYQYGVNVTTLLTLDPYTSEDAAVISKSLAKKLGSVEIETIDIGVNDNNFLRNIYGNNEVYQPLPEIGQYTDGIVAARTTLYNNQVLFDFKEDNLNKINFTSDTIFYSKGQVVDINIYCNNDDVEINSFNSQLLKYLNSQTKYYQEIFDTCEEIMNSGMKYSHDIEYLYKRSKDILNNEYKWKDGDGSFSNMIIQLEIRREVPAYIGQKITGRYGNKSVISQIWDDEDMPYTEGKRVDLLINLLAIINRTTAFPMYEMTINFMCRRVIEQLKTMKTLKEKEHLLFDFINAFNENQAKSMRAVYKTLSTKEKNEYIDDCINDRIYIHQSPLWETKPIFYRIMDLYDKYDFFKPYDVYVNRWGRKIKTLNQQYIGDMYILKLKQTSKKGFSARSTGSINTKGLPERSYKNKSHQELISRTPIRFGEFETLRKIRGYKTLLIAGNF